VFIYADPPYPTAGHRLYVHSEVDVPAVLAGCLKAQGPAVMSCEAHADVVSQAEVLGLACVRVQMRGATNQFMRELLISNRPLPRSQDTDVG